MQKKPTLEEKMLHYFRTAGCADSEYKELLPSFVRFAHSQGLTMQTLRAERENNASFAEAYDECEEILIDRIIDGALHKRLDASFAKFLLSERFGIRAGSEEKENEDFRLEVILKEPTSSESEESTV